jgi:hypothetical protein
MGGFKSFWSAAITLAGIELAHRIRKRQFSLGRAQSDCKYWENNKFDVPGVELNHRHADFQSSGKNEQCR